MLASDMVIHITDIITAIIRGMIHGIIPIGMAGIIHGIIAVGILHGIVHTIMVMDATAHVIGEVEDIIPQAIILIQEGLRIMDIPELKGEVVMPQEARQADDHQLMAMVHAHPEPQTTGMAHLHAHHVHQLMMKQHAHPVQVLMMQ